MSDFNNLTLAELLSMADSAPAGAVGVPSDQLGVFVRFTGKQAIPSGLTEATAPTAFTELTDVPDTTIADAGKVWAVNEAGDGFELITVVGGGGSSTFEGLSDTPDPVLADADKFWGVNDAGDGYELRAAPPRTFLALSDTPNSLAVGDANKVWQVNAEGDAMLLRTLPTAPSRLVDLSDTEAGASEGEGYVYRLEGLGPGSNGFVLESFLKTDLTVSPYIANRALFSNGSAYVDVSAAPVPPGTQGGQLPYWNSSSNSFQFLSKGNATDVISGTSGTGAPAYTPFQTLLDAANVPDNSLSQADQTLTASRQVVVGSNILTLAAGIEASVAVDGVAKRVSLNARVGSDGATMRMDSSGLQLQMLGTGKVQLWNSNLGVPAYEPGLEGQAMISKTSGGPIWGWPKMVTQSTNGTVFELTVDDEGTVIANPNPTLA